MGNMEQQVLNPNMLEGCIICSVQLIPGSPPIMVMELENRQEQRQILRIIPYATPVLNGNLLVINPGIHLNLNNKEGS